MLAMYTEDRYCTRTRTERERMGVTHEEEEEEEKRDEGFGERPIV